MIALFSEKGWAGTDLILRVGTIEEILDQLAYVNDWRCLIYSGKSMGPKSDQPKLKKLSTFLQKCSTRKDLEKFNIIISTGELGCLMCADQVEELENMRSIVLSSHEESYHERLNALFDRLIVSMETKDSSSVFFKNISSRQYITTGIGLDDYLE